MTNKLRDIKLKINWTCIMIVREFNKYLLKKEAGMQMGRQAKLVKEEKIIIIKILKGHKVDKIPIKLHSIKKDPQWEILSTQALMLSMASIALKPCYLEKRKIKIRSNKSVMEFSK